MKDTRLDFNWSTDRILICQLQFKAFCQVRSFFFEQETERKTFLRYNSQPAPEK